jgi:hypothetical protein
MFITFVENSSVNAQPLSPPIFEKIEPDVKNKVFSYFGSLRLSFSYFLVFLLIFGCPFPPPALAQIGPICGRCRSHFCSVLVEVGERSIPKPWPGGMRVSDPHVVAGHRACLGA